MDFKESASILADAAGRALGKICNTFTKNKNLGYKTFTTLFNSCVTPILDYSSGVWGYKEFSCSESIQNRAMRFFLGVNRFTPTHAVIGDMGWDSDINRRKLNMLRLWNRLIQLDESRLSKKVFLWDYSICRNNWTADVRKIFYEIGNQECFHNLSTTNLDEAKNNLFERLKNTWSESILLKPKLRTYILFKHEFCIEKYVTVNLSLSDRSYLAQFRAGNLPLHIETGRYVNTPVEERFCFCCDLGKIEDEFHFMFDCPLYNNIRNDVFSKIAVDRPDFFNLGNVDKLKILMNLFPRQLAKFIKASFQIRCQFLFPVNL